MSQCEEYVIKAESISVIIILTKVYVVVEGSHILIIFLKNNHNILSVALSGGVLWVFMSDLCPKSLMCFMDIMTYDKMDATFQTTFSNAFSWMKI